MRVIRLGAVPLLAAAVHVVDAAPALAVVGGALELRDLGAAHLGSALPDLAARVFITLVLGVGVAAVLLGLLELRRGSLTPAPPGPRTGTEPSPGGGTRTASPESPTSG